MEKEYYDGDLIYKGYVRKRVKILNDFLNIGVIKVVFLYLVMLILLLFKVNDKLIVFVKLYIVYMVSSEIFWYYFFKGRVSKENCKIMFCDNFVILYYCIFVG